MLINIGHFQLRVGVSWPWKLIAAWFIASTLILIVLRDWGELVFTYSFGAGYGGIVYVGRNRIRKALSTLKTSRFPLFLVTSFLVSVAEELYVYSLGNRIAVPQIWRDVIIVPGEWLVWFATWYLFTSRRYRFTNGGALLAAGLEGLMFEYIGNGLILSNPVGFVISVPLTIVVYAAIFILPMQFVDFSGQKMGKERYPVAVLLPYLLSIPATLLLFALVP